MGVGAGRRRYELEKDYARYWTVVTKVTNGAALPLRHKGIEVVRSGDSDLIARTVDPLMIKDVRLRKIGDVKIRIQLQQTVRVKSDSTWEVVACTTRLQYEFWRDDEPQRLGYHFDFSPGQARHPICHAQRDDGCIEATGALSEPFAEPRIPCAPLDLPAVVHMLVQDHFSVDIGGVGCKLGTASACLPRIRLDRQGFEGSFDCENWYIHGRET